MSNTIVNMFHSRVEVSCRFLRKMRSVQGVPAVAKIMTLIVSERVKKTISNAGLAALLFTVSDLL